jgi:methionine sulfoxide reductase heme-binding subunit
MSKKLNTWLVVFCYLGVAVPLVYLGIAYITNNLSVNPVLTAEQHSGDYAVTLLLSSLASTPLFLVTGFSVFIRFRPILGLSAFFYAFLHFMLFIWPDYGFDLSQILLTISRKPYIIIGLSVLVILIILAITSLKKIRIAMKRNWKTVQRFVYLASAGAVLHYGLAVKGNLLTFRGNVRTPYIYAGVLFFLLILRIPPVQKAISVNKKRITSGKEPQDLV